MILKRLEGGVIGTEALISTVVILIDGLTRPSVTLDAKVVVASASQRTLASPTLQQSLCQRDTGRDFPFQHLLNGAILILVDIALTFFG